MTKRLINIFLVALVLFACDDPYEDETFQAYDLYPTGTYLDSRQDEFSGWIEILHFADLYNAVNQASKTYTCFVPDNDAVDAFLKEKGVSSVQELGKEYVRNLVHYHIIEGEVEQKEFLLGGRLTKPTISEDYLSVSFDEAEGGGVNSVFINDEARVEELAKETTNGLVYVLNDVLTPLVETIYDRLGENENYSIFKDAVDLTGWSKKLNTPYDTTYFEGGAMSVIKRNFTLFVVNNDIFSSNSIKSVEELINTLGASADYTSEDNALNEYVAYHLLSQTKYEEDLFPFSEEDSTLIWDTQTPKQVFSTNHVNGENYINYSYSAEDGIQVIEDKTDIPAKNGILHEIDGLMPVWSPAPMTVIWDICDYSDVASVVNAYGAENELGDCFQVFQSSEHQISLMNTDITSYAWEANSTSSTWTQLGYLLTKANSGSTDNTYGANLNDMLVINLGYMGWVSMPSPVILKGRYKVELYYACAGSLSDFINGGSKCRFSLDDESSEVYVYDGAKASVGIYSLTMFDEIEFDETVDHNFKIVLMDSRATSHSSYRLQLDYVKFIPITE
jgi:uncharacterized surface protein with fasciclin (FAS1) repeats